MADSTNPANIPAGVAAVAGYVDGPESAWPAEAWATFTVPALRVSVFASPDALGFDVSDTGNASPDAVATAVAIRVARADPSVLYVNGDGAGPMTDALRAKSVPWRPPGDWPAPGAYLWATVGNAGAGAPVPWAPVVPVAVQDRWFGTYDLSTLYPGWLPSGPWSPGPAPAPPAPPPAESKGTGMHAIPITVAVKSGLGWAPLPVPAAEVVSVIVEDENPETVGRYDLVPTGVAISTQTGPDSPNGSVVLAGGADGTWGVTLWVLDT